MKFFQILFCIRPENRIPEGKAPRFPKKPTIKQEGEKLIMECLLEANPSPEITWFQGNKVIADNSRVKMTSTPSGKDMFALALEITNPTIEDGGNYRCNACNTFGESNANIALNFQGRPSLYFQPGNAARQQPIEIPHNQSTVTPEFTTRELPILVT